MEAKGMMEELSDVSMINRALKVICRELGVERDRKLVLQIATLLVRLVKEGHSLDTGSLDLHRQKPFIGHYWHINIRVISRHPRAALRECREATN